MRRKVNAVGTGTLTVSLPKKWADNVGLRKGDEIELVEDGRSLVLGAKAVKRRRNATIHLDSKNIHYVRNLIGAIFRTGADDIHVTVAEPSFMPRVRDVLNIAPGCEFFSMTERSGVIKNVVQSFEFDTPELMRKTAHTLNVISEYVQQGLTEGKYASYDEIQALRHDVQKYRNLIVRAVSVGDLSAMPDMSLAFFLSQIAGSYREMYQWLAAHPKKAPEEATMLKEIAAYTRDMLAMTRSGDELYNGYAGIRDDLQKAMHGKCRPEVCAYMFSILRITFASVTLVIESKQKQ